MNQLANLCNICSETIYSSAIKCSICTSFFHKKCCKTTNNCLNNFQNNKNWYCLKCSKLFVYHCIDDDEFLLENNHLDLNLNLAHIYKDSLDFEFKPFDYTEFRSSDFEGDIDPENHFFNQIDLDCKYFTESQLNHSITKENGLSIIHFNCRSLNANFKKIEEFILNNGYSFDVIACSETWLKKDSSIPELEGYNFVHQPRNNSNGGGVALYISNQLNYKSLDKCTIVVNDVLECLAVELVMDKGKNIVISCIYRKPGSPVDSFIDILDNLFSSLCKRKNVYLCGDFNINLLNAESHKATKDYLNFLYSLGLYPLINKPTRFAFGSASLIDNIFTNDINNNHLSGLVFNDISDHLPVFSIKRCYLERKPISKFINLRKTDEEAINAFKSALDITDWNSLLNINDVNICYDTFLNYFTTLYNQNCPVKQIKVTKRKAFKPWFTRGLQNACKKKNNLYSLSLRSKDPHILDRYKRYKNKLTKILRLSEKQYFDKFLKEHKNNTKGTWKILNNIVGNKKKMNNYPETFKQNDKIFKSKEEISNGFNNFFANVGPDLAKKINVPENIDITEYLEKRQVDSMFLKPTNEEEILQITKQMADKNSTDSNDLSMFIL